MNCAKEKQLQAVSFAHVRGLAGQVQFERCPERVSSPPIHRSDVKIGHTKRMCD